MKSLIFIVVFFIVTVIAESDEEEWESFKIKFRKHYANAEEELLRKSLFMKTLEIVKKHQERFHRKEVSWSMAINHMSDFTEEEKQHLFGYKPRKNDEISKVPFFEIEKLDLPDNFSWIGQGVMTPAKDQSHCGSCWAFSTVEGIESAYAIKTGKLEVLSPQNLVDCDQKSDACAGSNNLEFPLSYAMENGIQMENDYPYEAKNGTCRVDKQKPVVKISNYTRIKDDEALMEAVLKGPVMICVAIDNPWFTYKNGIIDTCGSSINHAILLVGFGIDEDTKEKYWIIRNSWGAGWGENGFGKLSRKKTNMCEISTESFLPIA